MIAHPERTFEYAQEISEGATAYLIERALNEARGQQIISPHPPSELN